MYFFWRSFWDKIWPRVCISCACELVSAECTLCSTCLDEVLLARLPKQGPLPLLQSLDCWLDFDIPSIQRLFHQLKFGQSPEIAFRLGQLYASMHDAPDVDALIPAPLSWRRKWSRGYNQSAWLVRGLSETWELPVWDVLRKDHRAAQATLGLDARSKSAQGAYHLKRPIPPGTRVQIWDDTLTTGATLQAMAETLYQGGAKEVHGATLARAD